jgi:hypothetical protein
MVINSGDSLGKGDSSTSGEMVSKAKPKRPNNSFLYLEVEAKINFLLWLAE